MVARPVPAAEIAPEGWLGPGDVVWTKEGTHKGCPYGDSASSSEKGTVTFSALAYGCEFFLAFSASVAGELVPCGYQSLWSGGTS